jgi:hypothetical protein
MTCLQCEWLNAIYPSIVTTTRLCCHECWQALLAQGKLNKTLERLESAASQASAQDKKP